MGMRRRPLMSRSIRPGRWQTSTMTAPCFIVRQHGARVIELRRHAAPGTSTVPISRSARLTISAIALTASKRSCCTPVPKCERQPPQGLGRLRSTTVTLAPMPSAIVAAWVPATPPPRMITSAGGTPGTPPSRTPRPPASRSEAMRADLRRQPAGHFRHRRQQRQPAGRAPSPSRKRCRLRLRR